ncbi:MAG TPA: PAS domain S-box protein, partial [Bacteroidota bacterium]|nr:PAS domain S-box protein [Bacteroidota bacterium]
RKLLGYTRAFAERFFRDPAGKPPSLTLNTVVGDWNVTFAREIKAMRPDTSLEREVRIATPKGEHAFRVTASANVADDERTTTLILEDVQAYVTTIRSLEESEARARVLIETRSAAIALIRQGKFVYVNKGYLELFGYLLREDLVGKDVSTVVAGRERKNIAERLQRPLSADTPLERFEYTGVRKDGSRVNVQVLEELIDVEGEPTLLWYHVDVTHLRTAQQDVVRERRENEILSHILESLHKSVDRSEVIPPGLHASLRWFSYESGCALMVNDTNTGFLLEHQENLSERLQDALRDLNMNEGLGGFLMKTMEPVRFTIEEYPPYLPHKSLFESEGVKRIICFPLSGSEGAVGIVILLSQRSVEHEDTHASFLPTVARHLGFAVDKSVKHQVTAQRAAGYQTALESLSDVVYETTPNGQYRYCSPGIERLTGYKVREVTASSDAWRAIVHPDDRSLLSQRISRQSDQEQEFVLEYRILPRGKAAYKWVRDAVRYRRDANGVILAIYGVVSDITASKTGGPEVQRSVSMSTRAVGEMRDALGEGNQIVRSEGDQIARGADDRTGLSAGEQESRNAANRMAGSVSEDQGSGEEFRQTDRQLAMLGAISQGLAGALDTQSVFAQLHEQMREPLTYGQLSYHEFDPATNKLLPVFEAGPDGDGGVTGSSRDALNVDDFPLFARAVSTKEPWSGEGDEGKSELL